MKVSVHITQRDALQDTVLLAFAAGVGKTDECIIRGIDQKEHPDIAVFFGIPKYRILETYGWALPKRHIRLKNELIQYYQNRKIPMIHIDSGYIQRDFYLSVGIGGLNNRAQFNNYQCPGDRWAKLGAELSTWRTKRKTNLKTLLVGQVPHDCSVQHIDFLEWFKQMYSALDDAGYEVILRPHPKAKATTPVCTVAEMSYGDLQDDLNRVGRVVTFNSNVGVDAMISGVPVFCADEGSMVFDIAKHSVLPWYKEPNRKQWAYNLAYTQWTIEEMRQGLPWQHLKPALTLKKEA